MALLWHSLFLVDCCEAERRSLVSLFHRRWVRVRISCSSSFGCTVLALRFSMELYVCGSVVAMTRSGLSSSIIDSAVLMYVLCLHWNSLDCSLDAAVSLLHSLSFLVCGLGICWSFNGRLCFGPSWPPVCRDSCLHQFVSQGYAGSSLERARFEAIGVPVCHRVGIGSRAYQGLY